MEETQEAELSLRPSSTKHGRGTHVNPGSRRSPPGACALAGE